MANVVANIFGASPVQPLEKHIDVAFRCAKELRVLFSAVIADDWEAASASVEEIGVRRAVLRTGVVLAREGGALAKMLLPFRLFAGGPAGIALGEHRGGGEAGEAAADHHDALRARRVLLVPLHADRPTAPTWPFPTSAWTCGSSPLPAA